jgi:hypothetical protein
MLVRVLAALLLATGVSAGAPTYESKTTGQLCALIGTGTEYPGYFKGTATSDAVCKQYCDYTPQCGGYSYNPTGTLCYLFGNIADNDLRSQKGSLGGATETENTKGMKDIEIQVVMTATAGTNLASATCHVKKVDEMDANSGHRAAPTAVAAAAVLSGAAAALCV